MEIKDLSSNQTVSGQYMIVENQLRTAKNGSSYLAMKVSDCSGEMAVKVWDADESLFQVLTVGRVIELNNLRPKTYRDQIQLDWDAKNQAVYKLVPETEVDYAKFLPKAPGDVGVYWRTLTTLIATITDANFRKILAVFFDDPQFIAEFIRVPAALKRHHAYIGGLLEHTVGVTSMCRAAAEYYPLVNRDLLLTGAILHDIGKVRTYKIERGIEGTDEGKLIGHLILGIRMVETAIEKVFGPADEQPDIQLVRNSLLHLLVSHHGIMEWGSPIEPLTIEACILHHIDNLDAQTTKFLTIIRAERNGNEWSAYDSGLGRSVYLGCLPKDQTEASETNIEEGA